MSTRKLWKCGYCGLETQGYGVYSHQQSCDGYGAERAKKEGERKRKREDCLAAEEERLESAIKNGAVEGARDLIDKAHNRGWLTPTNRMRRRFLGEWGAKFEAVAERSDITVLPPSANADRQEAYSLHARVRHVDNQGLRLDVRLPKRTVCAYVSMGGLQYYLDNSTGEEIAECLGACNEGGE